MRCLPRAVFGICARVRFGDPLSRKQAVVEPLASWPEGCVRREGRDVIEQYPESRTVTVVSKGNVFAVEVRACPHPTIPQPLACRPPHQTGAFRWSSTIVLDVKYVGRAWKGM